MKNIIFSFILALIISLAACTTEDGPVPGENFQLALSTDVQFQSINDTIPFEIELTDDIDPFTSEPTDHPVVGRKNQLAIYLIHWQQPQMKHDLINEFRSQIY